MKKLNLAIIGQGRSGRGIHGAYYQTPKNIYYNVAYVVDADAHRREVAKTLYPGCKTVADYLELFDQKDIDLVVNASYSQMHYPITEDLLLHGFHVLVEKPFAKTKYECDRLIAIAKEKNLTLAVFQQSFLAPIYTFTKEVMQSGKLGKIKQIRICYNGFARRWDWQTLQKNCAGGLYNTGPHPVGIGLGLLDFDPNTRVAYSALDALLTSGDGDDFAKIILDAPNRPVVDIEVISQDAYSPYNIKLVGSKGTYTCTTKKYKMTYIKDGENPPRPVVEGFLQNENGDPIYCSEALVKHTEEGDFSGDAFDIGTETLYRQLYYKLTEGSPMDVTPEMAAQIVSVIETAHAMNPMPLKFL